MDLYTGKRLHSYEWTELPIDDDVIAMVERLAQDEKAQRMTDQYPMFEWAPGVPILDELLPIDNNDNENDDGNNVGAVDDDPASNDDDNESSDNDRLAVINEEEDSDVDGPIIFNDENDNVVSDSDREVDEAAGDDE